MNATFPIDAVYTWVDGNDPTFIARRHQFVTENDKPDDRRIISKPALLGQDLQYVYTTAENIDRIRAAVLPFGVEVRDIAKLV